MLIALSMIAVSEIVEEMEVLYFCVYSHWVHILLLWKKKLIKKNKIKKSKKLKLINEMFHVHVIIFFYVKDDSQDDGGQWQVEQTGKSSTSSKKQKMVCTWRTS